MSPKPRGFARLSPEHRRELARRGGKAVQATGKEHRWTREQARAAGRKGGIARKQPKQPTPPRQPNLEGVEQGLSEPVDA